MSESGLVAAYLLDGEGGGTRVGWNDVRTWTPGQGLLWVYLDCTHLEAREWVARESGVDELTAEALLAEDTRPPQRAALAQMSTERIPWISDTDRRRLRDEAVCFTL